MTFGALKVSSRIAAFSTPGFPVVVLPPDVSDFQSMSCVFRPIFHVLFLVPCGSLRSASIEAGRYANGHLSSKLS